MASYDGEVRIKTTLDNSKLEAALSGLGKKIIAGLAVKEIGAAIADIAKESVGLAADFESALSGIKSVTGASMQDMDAFRELAIQTGADTKYSALESAAGIEELAKAGISTADILNGGLTGALSLAAAGEIGLADAAEIASTVLNAFRDDNLSVADAADILAGAANASATDVGELKFGLSQVSAIAAGVGMTFDDTATALAVFAQSGLKGSDAGTSLKTMLSRLQPMTDKAAAKFEELGLMANETTSAFYDQAGELKPLNEIADLLSESMSGLSGVQRKIAMDTIFGSDAARAANILFREGAEGVNKMNAEMKKFTAADVAAERMDNLRGRMEELDGTLETIKINVGTLLLPAMDEIVQHSSVAADQLQVLFDSPEMQANITSIGEGFASIANIVVDLAATAIPMLVNGLAFVSDHSEELISILAGVAAVIATMKIQALAASFQAVAASVVKWGTALLASTAQGLAFNATLTVQQALVALVTGSVGRATAAQQLWNAVMVANPIGAVALAVGALIAAIGLLYTAYKKTTPETQKLCKQSNQLTKESKALREELERSNGAFEENISNLRVEAEVAADLAGRLDELSSKEGKSAGDKAEMAMLVDQLNESMAGLNLAYDAQTDSLNQTIPSIYEYIEAQKQAAEAEAYAQRVTELTRERILLEEQLAEATSTRTEIDEQLQMAQDKLAVSAAALLPTLGATSGVTIKAGAETAQLAKESSDLSKHEEELREQIEATNGKIDDAAKKNSELAIKTAETTEAVSDGTEELSGAVSESMDEAISAYDRFLMALGEGSEEYEKELKDHSEKVEEWASTFSTAFEKVETKSKTSLKQMAENIQHNNEEVRAFTDNCKYLESELNSLDATGFLDYLETLDPGEQAALAKRAADSLKSDDAETREAAVTYIKQISDSLEENSDLISDAVDVQKERMAQSWLDNGGVMEAAEESTKQTADAAKHGLKKADLPAAFETEASNAVSGFVNVIEAGGMKAHTASYGLGRRGLGGLKKAQNSSSPSKETQALGRDFGSGYTIGIEDKYKDAAQAGKGITQEALTAIQDTQDSHSASEVTRGLGNDGGQGYGLGYEDSTDFVVDKATGLVLEGIEVFEDNARLFGEAGKEGGSQLAGGLAEEGENVKKTAEKVLEQTIQVFSDNDRFRASGMESAYQFASGFEAQSENVSAIVSKLYGKTGEEVDKYLSEKDNKVKLSTQEEAQLYFALADQYGDAMGKRREFDEKALDATEKYLKDALEKKQTTAFGVIKVWQNVADKYKEGTWQRQKADEEYFSSIQKWMDEITEIYAISGQQQAAVYDELAKKPGISAKLRAQAESESFKATKEHLSDLKEMSEMTAKEEVAYWEEAVKKYTAGTKTRAEADKELFKAKKALFEEEKKLQIEYNKFAMDAQVEYWEQQKKQAVDSIKAQQEVLEEGLKQQQEAVEASAKAQQESIKEASENNIEQYNREFNAKLKLLDAETAAEVAAIQAQIDQIDGLTKMEDEAERLRKHNEKKADLETKKAAASTAEEKASFQKQIDDLIAEENRRHELRMRDAQKEGLRQQIQAIKDAAAEKKEAITEEKNTLIQNEKEGSEAAIAEVERRKKATLDGIDAQVKANKAAFEQQENDLNAHYESIIVKTKEQYEKLIRELENSTMDATDALTEEIEEGLHEVPDIGANKGKMLIDELVSELKAGKVAAQQAAAEVAEAVSAGLEGENIIVDFATGEKIKIPKFHGGGQFKATGGGKEGLALLRDGEVVFTPEQLASAAASLNRTLPQMIRSALDSVQQTVGTVLSSVFTSNNTTYGDTLIDVKVDGAPINSALDAHGVGRQVGKEIQRKIRFKGATL